MTGIKIASNVLSNVLDHSCELDSVFVVEKFWQRHGPVEPGVEDVRLFRVVGRDEVIHCGNIATRSNLDLLSRLDGEWRESVCFWTDLVCGNGADVEAVIMIDRSGSMASGQNDRRASEACWTIKRALEQIGAPVTVYAFDDKAEVAYKRTELAHRTQYKFIYGNGGTNPYTTLLAAEQLFISSRRKNKMLFIVTDGAFDASKNDEVIDRIAKRGVLTAMTLIMDNHDAKYYEERGMTEKEFRHGAEIFGRIKDARDLLPFAKAVVVGAIKKRGGR